MSLPCISRKNGAAGHKIKLVATIAPVIAPVWPPPLVFLTALRRVLLPSTRRTLSMFRSNLPPRAKRLLACAAVTVAHAFPPLGITTTPCTTTSSTTSKLTSCPTVASADEMVSPRTNLTEVAPSRTKALSGAVVFCVCGSGRDRQTVLSLIGLLLPAGRERAHQDDGDDYCGRSGWIFHGDIRKRSCADSSVGGLQAKARPATSRNFCDGLICSSFFSSVRQSSLWFVCKRAYKAGKAGPGCLRPLF
jgi:hypothetical protein